MAMVFVALYERMHWLVDSSVVLGLHPDLNPTSSADLWQNYSHERKRRSGDLRSVLTELYGTLYKAVTEFDAASTIPAPQLDSELYFDPFAPPANLPWFPTSADWCEAAVDIEVGEPWRAWWLRVPSSIRTTCTSVRAIPDFQSSVPLSPISATSSA
ncbi:unnamed protein product [Phytophthora fragariaefolia]|uniref:Unnamed protein product n=1 Tax=Phytophthora fragariaefolia TaxID=1490495 RepID=A0A9W6XL36_9STRA|nr:unnamed protein product [Phytophthora fragariaefolia]